ncbi:hypothetical protein [Rivibacter subsaxonicus]|uniref:Lipoprotein n=1 Tax=Rivibacter subsaxonicus TaxID=457575 RepID=A0A4Q7VGH6_9BURK|nr:hypothetical protein [Rivibacter subsaxonicus]RZT95104.1 hypothetical protein EV670_2852 [Rivibacter subsaxonicus]
MIVLAQIRKLVAATLGCAALLGGCASGYHYSELVGTRYDRTTLDSYPLIVSKVDGKSAPLQAGKVLVDPGLRRLVLQGPPGGSGRVEELTADLDVKPCTRYYLVAVKSNRLESSFDVKIDHEEPVGGCTPPPAK